jgi:hypothetical protein
MIPSTGFDALGGVEVVGCEREGFECLVEIAAGGYEGVRGPAEVFAPFGQAW